MNQQYNLQGMAGTAPSQILPGTAGAQGLPQQQQIAMMDSRGVSPQPLAGPSPWQNSALHTIGCAVAPQPVLQYPLVSGQHAIGSGCLQVLGAGSLSTS